MDEGADMAKPGRPKEDNPRETIVGVRLTKEERNSLLAYAKDHYTGALRTG